MKQLFGFSFLVFFLFACCSSAQQNSDYYQFKEGSYDGIGKWYMGREIAHVMGFGGISWLERDSREAEERTSRLIKNLNINESDIVADIGAGSGYHSFKMAQKAQLVYAVDIQDEMLEAIDNKLSKSKLKNIRTVKGALKDVNLEPNSIDKVLMVDVYHEFSFPREIMLSIKKALKPSGKIYLIEYRGEDPNVPIKPLHKMTEAQASKEMAAIGFKFLENVSNLPWQHCMIFIKDL